MSFEIIFRSQTNGRIHPDEAHSIVKRFVPVVLVAVGTLITIVGTAIGAETIAREEGKKVRRDMFTTMAKSEKKQLRNIRKIEAITAKLRETMEEYTLELAMSRAASYVELETKKIIATFILIKEIYIKKTMKF